MLQFYTRWGLFEGEKFGQTVDLGGLIWMVIPYNNFGVVPLPSSQQLKVTGITESPTKRSWWLSWCLWWFNTEKVETAQLIFFLRVISSWNSPSQDSIRDHQNSCRNWFGIIWCIRYPSLTTLLLLVLVTVCYMSWSFEWFAITSRIIFRDQGIIIVPSLCLDVEPFPETKKPSQKDCH